MSVQVHFQVGGSIHVSAVEVSVIIPTLNRSRLLREVLESLFAQTLEKIRYEIIVVDNASTDDTPQMIAALQKDAPVSLRYHRLEKDSGPAKARNLGARLASGRVLAFTDSDCRADSGWLAAGIAVLSDDIAFVGGQVLHKPEQRVRFFSAICQPTTAENPTYPTANIMYRREVFLAMGGFSEDLCFQTFFDNKPIECADTDLAWRIKEAGMASRFVPEMIIYHEVPLKKPLTWIVDPFRLFSLPVLVKRHPQLRTLFLYRRIFFRAENALFYLALLAIPLAFLHPAFLLLAAPYPLLLVYLLRENLNMRKVGKLLFQIPVLAARQVFVSAGLIYGSLRFRSLVL